MPIRDLMHEINIISPKLQEIAKRQEAARVQAELEGKKKQSSQQRRRK